MDQPSHPQPTDAARPLQGGIASVSQTARLRLVFLLPLILAILTTVAMLVASIYQREQRDVQLGLLRLQTSAATFYSESLRQDNLTLHTVMDFLAHDPQLRTALAARNRQALLARAKPFFDDMKINAGITHLYFTAPDRVNLLRVHQPERHGDVIDRVTTRLAQKTGEPASGVELGPLGTLTLRFVCPWYDESTHQLLGYVELGMEVDKVVANLRTYFGVDVFILLRKEFLQRQGWEDGMRNFGRSPAWDQFEDMVLSTQSMPDLPAELAERVRRGEFGNRVNVLDVLLNRETHQALFVPLQDAAGRNVGQMALHVNLEQEVNGARQVVYFGSAASVFGGAALFIFFYWLVGRLGARIERDENALRDLAAHDGLTGLFNHRMFYTILEAEIARAQRYGRQVSLLMIDIDHFKRVNDSYGHVTGDRVLEKLARVLQEGVRRVDGVCRYGGEEIAIVLPEMSAAAAFMVAERLRGAVEQTVFDTAQGQPLRITISIGVATFPERATTPQDLVAAADAALYSAKEGGRNRVC